MPLFDRPEFDISEHGYDCHQVDVWVARAQHRIATLTAQLPVTAVGMGHPSTAGPRAAVSSAADRDDQTATALQAAIARRHAARRPVHPAAIVLDGVGTGPDGHTASSLASADLFALHEVDLRDAPSVQRDAPAGELPRRVLP